MTPPETPTSLTEPECMTVAKYVQMHGVASCMCFMHSVANPKMLK